MRAYLSIDLDFWNMRDFPTRYFDRLVATGLPVTIVDQHHSLVPHVKKFDFDTLVNLDYHSDIADREHGAKAFSRQTKLECGTWVTHVRGIGRHYVWSYPDSHCYYQASGTCHGEHDPFDLERGLDTETVCGWSKLSHRLAWYPRFCDLVAIGFSISPGWADSCLVDDFKKWRKSNERLMTD